MNRIIVVILLIVSVGFSQFAKPTPRTLDHVKKLSITLEKQIHYRTVHVGFDTIIVDLDTTYQEITELDSTFIYRILTGVDFADDENRVPGWGKLNIGSRLDDSNIYSVGEKNGIINLLDNKWNQATNLLNP